MTSEWVAQSREGAEPPPVRVLTVDDQAVFRTVARDVIDATPGFESVGEAASAEEALDVVERHAPDIVFCDVRMPGTGGVELACRLHRAHPETLIVLISIEDAIDLPGVAALRERISLQRKQDFGPRMLRQLWEDHQA